MGFDFWSKTRRFLIVWWQENEEGESIKKLMLRYLQLLLKVANHVALLMPEVKQTEDQQRRVGAVPAEDWVRINNRKGYWDCLENARQPFCTKSWNRIVSLRTQMFRFAQSLVTHCYSLDACFESCNDSRNLCDRWFGHSSLPGGGVGKRPWGQRWRWMCYIWWEVWLTHASTLKRGLGNVTNTKPPTPKFFNVRASHRPVPETCNKCLIRTWKH